MAQQQPLIEINMNDTLMDVIRKVNTNFKLIKQNSSNEKTDINIDISDAVEDFTNALNGVIEEFNTAISNERTARQNKDTEIENGYCPLTNGLVSSQYLPSYVDDIIEAYPVSGATELSADWLSLSSGGQAFTPETGKIYILMQDTTNHTTNEQFRWSGGSYVQIVSSGEQGPPGPGVPSGGTTGQVLAKASNADRDTVWQNDKCVGYMADTFDNIDTTSGIATQCATVTLPSAGKWLIVAGVTFPSNATGSREVGISTNGTSISKDRQSLVITAASSETSTCVKLTLLQQLPADDYFVMARQRSGGAMTVSGHWQAIKLAD